MANEYAPDPALIRKITKIMRRDKNGRAKGSYKADLLNHADKHDNDQVCNKWVKRIDDITVRLSELRGVMKSCEGTEKYAKCKRKHTELSKERGILTKQLSERLMYAKD